MLDDSGFILRVWEAILSTGVQTGCNACKDAHHL